MVSVPLQVVGLYRLCGSAAVKKELRDWFERNSSAVCLSEDLYPDINVITGTRTQLSRPGPGPGPDHGHNNYYYNKWKKKN